MAGKKVVAKKSGGGGTGIIIAAAILVVAGVAAYFLFGARSPVKKAAADAIAYIEGVQKRDFAAVFDYNAASQRRKALITQRASGNKDTEIKSLFNEMKASFDEAQPTYDLRAQWVEKFLFVPGAAFKVIKVDMVQDTENPSQPGSERINAIVTVAADYPDQNSAPDLNGRVKSVEYRITMIHSRNVSRILREEVADKRWLFQSVQVMQETVKRW